MLSADPRTSSLFAWSGLRDWDSHAVLLALGPRRLVSALAAGSVAGRRVAVLIADGALLVVSLDVSVPPGTLVAQADITVVGQCRHGSSPGRAGHCWIALGVRTGELRVDEVPDHVAALPIA